MSYCATINKPGQTIDRLIALEPNDIDHQAETRWDRGIVSEPILDRCMTA